MAGGNDDALRLDARHALSTRRAALMRMGAIGLAAVFVGRGVRAAETHPGDPNTGYHKLAVTAKDYAFELPRRVPAGYTEITLRNEGAEEHHAMFMRLNTGTTTADFMRAAKQQDIAALFAMSSSIGGPGSVDHGQASTVIINLLPGAYVVICIVPDAQGMPHYKMGMLAALTVTEAAHAEDAPAADLTIDLVDFAFDQLPRQIRGGQHLWKVLDTGAQLHEMVLNRLAPGVSFEQAKAILMAPPTKPTAATGADASSATAHAAPFTAVAGVAPMNPASVNWAVLNLANGDYFAVCYVPDPETGRPHFDLGMIAPFSVTS
ncbi:hypothetical protein [Castellaniella caeni]|uniref:hypothetical protein n=1 Tax=Castellaniella caeni TaxID=266123 RepID=UPI00082B7852|nr:hypothetical protein [Castellaniella caeni]